MLINNLKEGRIARRRRLRKQYKIVIGAILFMIILFGGFTCMIKINEHGRQMQASFDKTMQSFDERELRAKEHVLPARRNADGEDTSILFEIPEFLQPEECADLLQHLEEYQKKQEEAKGSIVQHEPGHVQRKRVALDDDDLNTGEINWAKEIDARIRKTMRQPEVSGYFDPQLSPSWYFFEYEHGPQQKLEWHYDETLTERGTRKSDYHHGAWRESVMTVGIYLNTVDGGEFETMYKRQRGEEVTGVKPPFTMKKVAGTLILFEGTRLWHKVNPVNSGKSFGLFTVFDFQVRRT